MARWILLAIVSGIAAYAVFFYELGGKPFAGHVSDVWRSPAMQQKLRMVERSLGAPWRTAPPPSPAAPPPPTSAPPAAKSRPQRPSRSASTASNARSAHDENDRKALDALVQRLQKR